jgi:tetratricopeptide (TPR) repeat protein
MGDGKKAAVESILKDKSGDRLRQLLTDISNRFPDAYEFILRWHKSAGKINVDGELALELWEKAEAIIDRFNEYGGGPDEEEDEACDCIHDMCKLIPKLSWDVRQEIIDGMLVQYHYGNSGFDDILTETCFEMCDAEEEWLYLADRFLSYGGSWDKGRAMEIYREIDANDRWLQIRENLLEYGNDYLELAQYYEEQGDTEKALDTAHKGLRKGAGAMGGLISFLFDCYEQKNDTAQLEKLAQFCENNNNELEMVYGRLHEYYKTGGDYANAKAYLLKQFDSLGGRELNKRYAAIKDYLKPDDWDCVESKLFASIKERDLPGYLNICLEKGLRREVCDTITSKPVPGYTRYGLWSDNYDSFADRLMKDFPNEIITYYWDRAIALIESGKNRDNYINAMPYFRKVKNIYTEILKDTPLWERKLAGLRSAYPKRRALLEESRVLD